MKLTHCIDGLTQEICTLVSFIIYLVRQVTLVKEQLVTKCFHPTKHQDAVDDGVDAERDRQDAEEKEGAWL